jgi:hypothetical protein
MQARVRCKDPYIYIVYRRRILLSEGISNTTVSGRLRASGGLHHWVCRERSIFAKRQAHGRLVRP